MSEFAIQRFFRNAGYLKVPQAISTETVEELHILLDEEFEHPTPEFKTITDIGGKALKLYGILQRPNIGKILHDELSQSPVTHAAATALLGPNVNLTLNRHNHATNNYSGEQEMRFHRDVLQWSRSIVSGILFLDNASPENGATLVIPGSHLEPFVGVTQPDGGGTWMDEHAEYAHLADQAMAITAEPGDMLLFDGTLFHSIGLNNSYSRRRSIALGFKASDELATFEPTHEMILYGQSIYRGNDA